MWNGLDLLPTWKDESLRNRPHALRLFCSLPPSLSSPSSFKSWIEFWRDIRRARAAAKRAGARAGGWRNISAQSWGTTDLKLEWDGGRPCVSAGRKESRGGIGGKWKRFETHPFELDLHFSGIGGREYNGNFRLCYALFLINLHSYMTCKGGKFVTKIWWCT